MKDTIFVIIVGILMVSGTAYLGYMSHKADVAMSKSEKQYELRKACKAGYDEAEEFVVDSFKRLREEAMDREDLINIDNVTSRIRYDLILNDVRCAGYPIDEVE